MPQAFTKSQGSETTAQNAATFNSGPYGVDLTNGAGASGGIVQAYYLDLPKITGRSLYATVLAKTSAAIRVRLRLSDSLGATSSNYHQGDGQWHSLGVTRYVDPTATGPIAVLEIVAGDGTQQTATFDDLVVVVDGDASYQRSTALSDFLAKFAGTVTTSGAGPYSAVVTHNLHDSNPRVVCTPAVNAKCWITGKTTTAFTVNTDVAGSVDYLIITQ